jgi:hypothetical protein
MSALHCARTLHDVLARIPLHARIRAAGPGSAVALRTRAQQRYPALQDSLSGGSKVVMLLAVNPTDHDAPETLCSLNFAARLRGLELGPARRNTSPLSDVPVATTEVVSPEESVSDPERVSSLPRGSQDAVAIEERGTQKGSSAADVQTERALEGARAEAGEAQGRVSTLEEELFSLQEQLVSHQVHQPGQVGSCGHMLLNTASMVQYFGQASQEVGRPFVAGGCALAVVSHTCDHMRQAHAYTGAAAAGQD